MPTLTLANSYAAGDALVASDWNENMYDPTAPNTSFEIINGHLDKDNMDATWPKILPEQVQRGVYGSAGFSAGTANLDYFKQWFSGCQTSVLTSTYPTRPMPIPGGNATFYVSHPVMAVFTWTICWTNISDNQSEATRIHLYVDDALKTSQRREVRATAEPGGPTGTYARIHQGRIKNRYWVGHHTMELGTGHHTAGLRILADENVPQSRVWARSFRYILMKKPQTWG